MPKMYFSSRNCEGVTSGVTGRTYNADSKGFVQVDDSRDVKALQSGGYVIAGGMPRLRKYYLCEACGWEAAISHCPKCDSDELTKVELSSESIDA